MDLFNVRKKQSQNKFAIQSLTIIVFVFVYVELDAKYCHICIVNIFNQAACLCLWNRLSQWLQSRFFQSLSADFACDRMRSPVKKSWNPCFQGNFLQPPFPSVFVRSKVFQSLFQPVLIYLFISPPVFFSLLISSAVTYKLIISAKIFCHIYLKKKKKTYFLLIMQICQWICEFRVTLQQHCYSRLL